MADNETLSTTAPPKPGVYIGKIYRNQAGPPPGFRRYPNIVGKGSRLKTQLNIKIVRSYLDDVPMTIASVSPHTATLPHNAIPDQTVAQLKKLNNDPVPNSKWRFIESVQGSGNYDTILLTPDAFDPTTGYTLSYQSNDRTIQDALPFDDLREIKYVGDTENQARYNERADFFVPIAVSDPVPNASNANSETTDHGFTAVAPGTNIGTAVVTIGAAQTPLMHPYNRVYTARVTSTAPHVIRLEAAQGSGGLDSRAPVPLHPSLPTSLFPATMSATAPADASTLLTFTDPEIGETISLLWDLTSSRTSSVGDTYTFTAFGHSFIEVDAGISNTNQFPTWTVPVGAGGNTGSGTVAVRSDATYTALTNRNYRIICTAVTGSGPSNRTASFVWAGWGETPGTNGSFTINETTGTNNLVAFDAGLRLKLSFGDPMGTNTNFAVGDKFDFTAKCARKVVTAKDSRDYTITIGAATAGAISGTYLTNTLEGGFNALTVTGPTGQLRLPGDVDIWFRNIGTTLAQNRYVAADVFTFSTTDEEVIDWSLTTRKRETVPVTKVVTDVLGLSTGTPGAPFVILEHVPTSIIYVRDSVTQAIITTATIVANKPILKLAVVPANPIEVNYEYIGPEPVPGSAYYVSANVVRPLDEYNRPIFFSNYDDSAAPALGPSGTDNDVLIAAQIMLKDCGAPGIYVTQVFDSNGAGVYSTIDYNLGIQAALKVSKNTDIIVLNKADTLSTQLQMNETGNSPFLDHVGMALWVGMPIGSTIGDIDTPGSLVHMAKSTLQLPAQSQAKGTRVLVANWEARKVIQLVDGSQVEVTLDGSFVAAAAAALNASFTDPNTVLLNRVLPGFSYIRSFNEDEILSLVGASILYVYNVGTDAVPVYKFGDGVTIDTSEDSLNQINVAINVRTFTTSDMKDYLTQTCIGVVYDSAASMVASYRSNMVMRMGFWRQNSFVADWQDAEGTERPLDPNVDVQVYASKQSKTLVYFKYAWFGKYANVRGYGLYAVDTANLGQPS